MKAGTLLGSGTKLFKKQATSIKPQATGVKLQAAGDKVLDP